MGKCSPKTPLKAMARKKRPTTSVGKAKAKKPSADSVTASKESKEFVKRVGRALRRAAKVARKVAKQHGTPIYVWENSKVVAKKP